MIKFMNISVYKFTDGRSGSKNMNMCVREPE